MRNIFKALLNSSKEGANVVNNDSAHLTDPHPYQINLAPFTDIDLDTATFSVQLHAGADYHVTVTGKYKDYVTVKVEGSTLVVQEKGHHLIATSLGQFPRIIITVPADTKLGRVDATNAAGSINISQLNMDELALKLSAGSAVLTNIEVSQQARLILEAGSLKINRCTLSFDAQIKAGSAKIDTSKLRKNSHIILESGSLSVTSSPDIGYDLAATIGTISYHGKRVGHHFSKNFEKASRLTAKAEVGSIKIK